jgi:hypothetical protein
VGEVADLLLVDGHRHEEVEQPDAGAPQVVVPGQSEEAERFAQLVVRVTAGRDAEPVPLGGHGDPVELVGDAVAAGQLGADLLELALHLQGVRREQAATGVRHEHLAVELHRRRHGADPVGVDVDRAGAVGDRRDQLEPDPDAAGPRQRDGVTAEVERLLHVAGEQDRHVQVDERGVARAGQRGGLGGRVVADDRHHAAVAGRAGEHAVADRVARPVEARSLAVPDADDPVVALVPERVDELAAHHGRRGELLVEPGAHDDRQVGHRGRGGRCVLLERGDGRALVARDERRGGEAVAPIDAQLVDREPGEGLHAGQEDAPLLAPEPVVELVRGEVGAGDEIGHRSTSGVGAHRRAPARERARRGGSVNAMRVMVSPIQSSSVPSAERCCMRAMTSASSGGVWALKGAE